MTDFAAILKEAHEAAAAAQVGMVEGRGLDCGFAWVTISGTEPLARYCRKKTAEHEANAKLEMSPIGRATEYSLARFHGGKGYPTGWQFWKPGDYAGQSIGIHIKGAEAFNEVLAKYNIRGTTGSRYD